MDEWREADRRFRPEVPASLRRLFLPEPTATYRWRVALACGCVFEEWTRGADDFPDTLRANDPLQESREYGLRDLERRCRCQHPGLAHGESPYRRIVDWINDSRTVRQFDADPVQPPEGWDETPDLWDAVRNERPGESAHWVVRLECGHFSGVASSAKFRPHDGPKRATVKRLAEMRAEQAEYRAEHSVADDDAHEAHFLRMLDEGWPTPQTETTCFWCGGGTSTITAYQRVGWLEGKSQPPEPRKPKRQVLEKRLARLEAETKRLSQQLSKLPEVE